MIEIIPAVLPHSMEELTQGLKRLRGISKVVQIDVVEDIFTGARPPQLGEFDIEFDLFIEPAVERYLEMGASAIVVHARLAGAHDALLTLQGARSGNRAVHVGLGLRAGDTLDALHGFEGLYDYVQVMGISHEGKQGEPFDPRSIELVRALRQAYPELVIQVDGHVALHERALVEAGANRLVVGSAIIGAEDPWAAYRELYTKANGK